MTIVIYKSIYGSTKRYAHWLAKELNCRAVNLKENKQINLEEFDTIILGGGLYAGGILGSSSLKKQWDSLKDKKIVVFTVGLADPKTTNYQKIKDMCFNSEQQKNISFFHLRGSCNYSKLTLIHRLMMAMLKWITKRKKETEMTEEDKHFLATYGKKVSFEDRKTLQPIVEYVTRSALPM
ncbi:MAG: flavodoxin domain-containing protein [Candidatus Cloacimonetes bacterium]|nr:flavodoxin domain-containing protein [Candidatus Cloacimonadota bacterium]